MADLSPEQFADLLSREGAPLMRRTSQRVGTAASTLVAAGARAHMRDAKGEPKRRRADDDGDLRVVTGDYHRAVKARRGAGVIDRVDELSPTRYRYVKGVDPDVHPQAFNEEGWTNENAFGKGITTSAPARPTLEPGLEDAAPRIRQRAADIFAEEVRRVAGDGSGGITIPA